MMTQLPPLPMPDGMEKEKVIQLLLQEEYGFLPEAPGSVTAEQLSADNRFCAGKAPLIKLELACKGSYGSFCFPVSYVCPRADRPVPCFILINFGGEVPHKYYPAEEIADHGFAVLSFDYQTVTADSGDFTDGLAGVVYPGGDRDDTQCGKIGLWAWAAMRVMDYAQTLPELDHTKICVVGHSRLGKTALLTGALDERFYCAFSNDSGCSGAALSRGATGETIRKIYDRFPYWFCKGYEKYADHEDRLPFDQHFLLAANVPHRVYVASAKGDAWATPENEYLSCVAASGYYEARGMTGFVHPDRLPEAGERFARGTIGYHIREGLHYLSREDWLHYISYVNQKE